MLRLPHFHHNLKVFLPVWIWCLCVNIPLVYAQQPPGYLGKTMVLDLSLEAAPALRVASKRDLPPYVMNLQLQLELEKILSRRYSAGVFVRPVMAGALYEQSNLEGKSLIRGMNIGTSFRIYSLRRKGNIAPLGPYKKIDIMYLTYWMIDRDRAFYQDGRSWLGRYHDLGIGIVIGNRIIFHDQVSFHYGIRFATILGMFKDDPSSEQIYFKNLATNRLQGQYFFNFQIGIGIFPY